MKARLLCLFILSTLALTSPSHSAAPAMKTPSPVIHLVDNLDEKDNLGWCIDTQGRGFGERLHAHSCKPQGGDVQFSFNVQIGQIQSVAFSDYCMAHQPNEQTVFALINCDSGSAAQQFAFDAASKEIRLASDLEQCVAIGQSSASAGPFLSRELLLAPCKDVKSELKEWVISN